MKALSIPLKIALVVLILCIGAEFCFSATAKSPVRVTVLTYNIYHGEDANGGSNLDAVAKVINSLKPDLVALQEVDNKTTRAKGLDLTAELSRRTGMQGVFGKAMDFAGGGYGEAVLSRLPILSQKTHLLPHTPNAEPRAALEIQVQLPSGEKMAFVGTHLDHLREQKNRSMQATRINELYAECELPVLLAGDLNAIPGSDTMRLLQKEWQDADQALQQPTFPAVKPRRKIDYVLYRPAARWKPIETRVIDEKVASDHCPVLAVLELLRDDGDK